MKKRMKTGWMLLLLIALTGAAFAKESDQAASLRAAITGQDVALRQEASESAQAIATVNDGDEALVTSLGTRFCGVVIDGHSGFVATDALVFALFGGEPTRIAIAVPDPVKIEPTLSIRAQSDTKAKALHKLKNGEMVLLLESQGRFTHVATPYYEGYALSHLLKEISAEEGFYARVENDVTVGLRCDMQYPSRYVSAVVQPGQLVQVLREIRGWTYLETPGWRGYMVSTFLKPEDE